MVTLRGGRDSDEHRKKGYQDSLVAKVLIPIGSFLVALISFLTNVKELPTWATAVLGSFLIIVSVALLLPGGKWLLAKWRSQARIRQTSRQFLPHLDRMIQRLQDQLSQSHTDSLLYGLRNYASIRDGKGCAILSDEFSQATCISEWLTLASKGASRWNLTQPQKWALATRTREFVFVAEALDMAVIHYVRLCQSIESRLRGALLGGEKTVDDNLARQLKQAWNLGRESQGRLVHDWAKMGQEINDSIGFRVCIVNYSQLRPIE